MSRQIGIRSNAEKFKIRILFCLQISLQILKVLLFQYLFYPRKMLSESMLQKFTSKIEKLVSNQQSQRSQSQNEQQNSNNSQDIPSQLYRKLSNKNAENQEASDEISENMFKSEPEAKNGNSRNSRSEAINLDENDEPPKSQKIDAKQLAKLIEIEKQKSKAALNSNNGPKPNNVPQTIKKSVPQPIINKTPAPANNSKLPIMMPRVSTMNNLVKLSTKLSCKQLLSEVKYQASLLNMAPIRLLLYVCIQKMLFTIYMANAYERIIKKQRDHAFIEKQVESALVNLLGYLKNAERTMVSRILRAVFNRLGIPQYFSQKWLTQCVKKNRKALQKLNVAVQSIQLPPVNNNITSNIFIGIVSSQNKVVYDFPYLELEGEDQGKNERAQDPEAFHVQEQLFFFKKNFDREKFGQSKQTKKPKSVPKNNFNYEEGQNYEQSQFQIKISKLNIPANTLFASDTGNADDGVKTRNLKSKRKNSDIQEDQIISKRRNRSSNASFEESKYDYNAQENGENDQLKKAFILQIVQEYIFSNIENIADKIAEKWKIDPSEVRQLIRSSNESRSMPSKMVKTDNYVPTRRGQKVQSDEEIMKQMQTKSLAMQKAGIDRKEMLKEVLRILENKNLSNDRKEQIMNKWLAMMKNNKKSR